MNETKELETTKKKNSKIVSVIIIIFAILLIIGITSTSNSNTNDDNNANTNLEQYSIGETFSFDDLEITVKNYNIVSYFSSVNYRAKENCKFIVISVSIHNSSDNTKYLADNYIGTLYANNTTRYNTQWRSGSDEFIKNYSSIIAKDTIEGAYLFEIPDAIAKSSKLEFRFTFNQISKQDRIINVNLRDN